MNGDFITQLNIRASLRKIPQHLPECSREPDGFLTFVVYETNRIIP